MYSRICQDEIGVNYFFTILLKDAIDIWGIWFGNFLYVTTQAYTHLSVMISSPFDQRKLFFQNKDFVIAILIYFWFSECMRLTWASLWLWIGEMTSGVLLKPRCLKYQWVNTLQGTIFYWLYKTNKPKVTNRNIHFFGKIPRSIELSLYW